MKYIKVVILLLGVSVLFSGCVTQKRCSDKFPPQETIIVRDSVVYKDTTIYIPEIQYVVVPKIVRDSIFIEPIYETGGVTSDTMYMESNFAWAKAWVMEYELYGTISDKDTTFTVKPQEDIKVINQKESYHTEKKTEVVEVRYIPKFYKFCFWWWLGTTIVILLFIAYKIFKPQINVYNR